MSGLDALKKELKKKQKKYKTKQKSLTQLEEEINADEKLLEFYKYYNESREIEATDLIPDENRVEVIPPKDFAIQASEYQELADAMMSNLYDYIIHLTLKKNLIPHIKNTKTETLQLTCLDAGCSIGGVSFRLAKQKDVNKVYGVDLSPSFIEYAKQKQNKQITKDNNVSKLNFLCQDASVLSQFKNNEIDIGFCSLVLHEMPKRVPMNILCELSRVCKYMVVLDWVGYPYPWNDAGLRNRRIEFMAGASHFNGFLHFVKLGGIQAHIQSLMKYRSGVNVRMFKKIDKGTMGLYVLDTINAQMASKM
eukprot:271136_1